MTLRPMLHPILFVVPALPLATAAAVIATAALAAAVAVWRLRA